MSKLEFKPQDRQSIDFAEETRQKFKNLINNYDFESGDITNGGKNPSASKVHMRSKYFIKVLPNTTYTLNVFGDTPIDGSVKLYTEQSMSTGTHPFPVITSFPYTFTTKSDTNYVKVVLQYSEENLAILNNKQVLLELGEEANSFKESFVLQRNMEKLANFDLSNVTAPGNIKGSTTKGAGDRIVESYISSDGNTWYKKYASGWKECGGLIEKTGVSMSSAQTTVDIKVTLPISFSDKNYTINVTNSWTMAGGHSINWSLGAIEDRTINDFVVVAYKTNAHGTQTKIRCNWFCCGY